MLMRAWTATLTGALTLGLVVAGQLGGTADARPRSTAVTKTATTTSTTTTSTADWTYKALTSPARVQVSDATGVLATFTVGARTVTMRGAARTFTEPATTSATVRSTTWVRLLDKPFAPSAGRLDTGTTTWLVTELADRDPDLLAVAAQYVAGSPMVRDASGRLVSSDASYGPLQPDGTRAEGSDFNDYLGVSWTYGGVVDGAEADQAAALDCSGFTRMVFGYRMGLPMTLDPDGVRLPRRSAQMLASAPGVVTVPDAGVPPTSTQLSTLAPGDLVFFDNSTDDGPAVDHVGIYLGVDSAGQPRFISSRKTADGPTLGDLGGRSVLTGTGYYATGWRAARRL
jgi:cell wall-associated NlpC family hydrolase